MKDIEIGVSGALSVGKSTFISKLREHLPELNEVREAARDIIVSNSLDVNNFTDEQLDKFQTQVVYEQVNRELNTPSPWISDTTLSDTMAYAKDAPNSGWIVDYVDSYYNRKLYDIIFYIPIEIPLEDDGVRHTDEKYRKTIDERIIGNLHSLKRKHPNVKIVVLTGSVKERVNRALEAIKTF